MESCFPISLENFLEMAFIFALEFNVFIELLSEAPSVELLKETWSPLSRNA
jgi:hypothetical protein